MDTVMIISIVNQKGGVGKTTTAVNLGAALARAGHSTLLVDLDPQGNASSGVGITDEQRLPGIYELLRGEVMADAAMRPTAQENYHVMPATADLAGASVELMNVDNREFRLREVLVPLSEHYSYIIIDAPPSLGVLTMNALCAAQKVLIPVQCEYYALEGLGQLLQTIGLVKEHLHPELEVLGAVLTLFDRRVKVAHDVASGILEQWELGPYDIIILGGSGRWRGFAKTFWDPPVALKVALNAPCSVLVARELDVGHGHLICINGSEKSMNTIRKDAYLASRCECPIALTQRTQGRRWNLGLGIHSRSRNRDVNANDSKLPNIIVLFRHPFVIASGRKN